MIEGLGDGELGVLEVRCQGLRLRARVIRILPCVKFRRKGLRDSGSGLGVVFFGIQGLQFLAEPRKQSPKLAV